ncbi:MAG: hypothetical protein K9G76_06795 [Bacteroidales bacterium]|nr:hypothetical protein [Bacteroidales bacterium]MCF8404315.1 hypothetical protein [Bacteroidales bacterium]
MKKSLFSLTLFFALSQIFASDPPVSLISFYQDYSSIEEVGIADQTGELNGLVIPFLMDENNSIDQKAAVINTFAVSEKPKRNASTFQQFLARKYGVDFSSMDLNLLNGDELFCLGYLTLIDESGKTTNGLPILEMALMKNPQSKTVNLIYTIALAQDNLNKGNKCEAWKNYSNFTGKEEMNPDISNNITTYFLVALEKYKEACD